MITIAEFQDHLGSGHLLPVSCRVDGRPALFRVGEQTAEGRHRFIQDSSGLEVHLSVEPVPGLGFCRWRATLQGGERPVRVSEVRLADLRIPHPDHQAGLAFRNFTGGTVKHDTERLFPPPTFRVIDQVLRGHDIVRHYDPTGRGSNEYLPLWLLEEGGRGIWFGPEWCGTWRFEIHRLPEYSTVLLTLPQLDFVIQPGERITLPAMALGGFNGDLDDGCNQLRRVIKDHYLPDFCGAPPQPRMFFQVFGGPRERMIEPTVHKEVDVAARMGAETFTYASTWQYDDDPAKRLAWWNLMGHYRPAPGRFPEGIDPLADHLEREGMHLGLWIDPRIGGDSGLLEDPEIRNALLFCDEAAWETELRGQYNPISYDINVQPLMDLSRDAGRKLFADCLERMVSQFRARKIWFDLNTDPALYHFVTNDPPDRRGLLELQWFAGLETVLREFHAAHPDVWIEMCASGGRMINLTTLALGHSQWITDYTGSDPDIAGAIRTGANSVLPAVCVHQSYHPPKDHPAGQDLPWDGLLAHFAGDFGLAPELFVLPENHLQRIEKAAELWRAGCRLQNGDFYRLTPLAETRDAWDAWQFHDPARQEGLLCVRRLSQSTQTQDRLTLRGLPANAAVTATHHHGDAQWSFQKNHLDLTFQEDRVFLLHYQADFS